MNVKLQAMTSVIFSSYHFCKFSMDWALEDIGHFQHTEMDDDENIDVFNLP